MKHCSFFLATVLMLTLNLDAGEFAAGRETALLWEGTVNKQIKVYLPSNYREDTKWPLIVYYHGTNGFPDTSLMQAYTGQKDFIIVSMDYFIKGQMNFNTPEELSKHVLKEFDNITKVLTSLKGKVSFDPGKVILSGVSKGGWLTSYISEQKLDFFAGAAIFIGGYLQRDRKVLIPRTPAKPVYIGDGEYDANFYPSYACLEFYKKLKANPVFEYYDGIGHKLPNKIPARFSEWLNLFRPGYDLKIDEWYQKSIAAFKNDKTLKSYRELRESPYLYLLSIEQKKAFNPILKQKLEEDKNFEKELRAYNAFFSIIKLQSTASFPKDWENVILRYKKLFNDYDGTEYAKRAVHHYEAAQNNLKNSIEFYKKAEQQQKKLSEDNKTPPKGIDVNSGRNRINPRMK